MSTFTHEPVPRCVLVSVRLPGIAAGEADASLAELERLADTLGWEVVATVQQHRNNLKGATVVGPGKLLELARLTGGTGRVPSPVRRKPTRAELRRREEESGEELVEAPGEEPEEADPIEGSGPPPAPHLDEPADMVLFDCDLTPSQMQKLEGATGARVLDRTGVIIEIFSRHARTRTARLQVELARLAYIAPRLRETGAGERQGGGIGAKGAGETKLELDRRRIRDRMKEIREQLDGLAAEDEQRRGRRTAEKTVALVGYTNAGKSSLMRALTGSQVLVEDKLFATLDTTVRPLHPPSVPRILVSDTVGFISRLPHDLVASFRSTLEEAAGASLLLHVVDVSDAAWPMHLEVTRTVIAEVGAGDLPNVLVLNKRDRLEPDHLESLKREHPGAVILSALDPGDVRALRDRLIEFFEQGMVERELFLPWGTERMIGTIRDSARVLEEQHSEEGTRLRLRGPARVLDRLEKQLRESS